MRYLLFTASIFLFFACKKNDHKVAIIESEYQSWLIKNGNIFSSGSISFSYDNIIITGTLDWSSAKKDFNKGYEFLIVPFVFKNSPFKSKKVIFDALDLNQPTLNHLLFWKDKNGIIQARWRKRTYIAAFNNEPKKMFESFYTLKGELQSLRLWLGNEKPVSGQRATIINNARTTACSSPFAVTTNAVSCTGGMENTTCYFYKITTYYIFCVEGDGHPTVEPESVVPEDNGWYEFYSLTEELENKEIVDSLQGYPCAQEILKQLPSLNNEVKKVLLDVFGVNTDVNIVFKTNNTFTKDSADGVAIPPRSASATYFDATVILNPWVLTNSTQEYILVTMVHEAIHSYIDYWFTQYQTNSIDSNQFKNMFPIFWNPSRPRSNSEMQHHNEIATNYVELMSNAIQSFNSSVPSNIRNELALGGLHNTTVWSSRSDTISIKETNGKARDVSLNLYQQMNLKKCP